MADLPQSELRLGVGAERINPPLGVPLPLAYSGGGSPVAVEGRYDDCWARALVLQQDDIRLAIVAVDLCTMRDDQYQAIVDRIAARCRIPDENILIACTHNHSNASLLEPFDAPPSPWQETLNDLIVSAVYQASRSLEPVSRIRFATAKYGRVAHNRRVVLPDVCDEVEVVCMLIGAEPKWEAIVERLAVTLGTTREQLGISSEPIEPQGIVDDALRLLTFESGEGKTLASIVSAACHPVTHSFADRHTCADYPGYLVRLVEHELGGMGLFLQGCSGDVRPRYRESVYAEVERVGRQFGSALLQAVSRLQDAKGPHVIGAVKQQVELPLKQHQTREQQQSRLDELELSAGGDGPNSGSEHRSHPGTLGCESGMRVSTLPIAVGRFGNPADRLETPKCRSDAAGRSVGKRTLAHLARRGLCRDGHRTLRLGGRTGLARQYRLILHERVHQLHPTPRRGGAGRL